MESRSFFADIGDAREQIRAAAGGPGNLYATFCPYDFLIMSTVPFPSYDELTMQMQFELRQSTHSRRCLRVIAVYRC